MSLARLVAFVEDGPWCGTSLVRPVPPVRLAALPAHQAVDEAAPCTPPLSPQPEIAAHLWQAIRLHQYAYMLSADKRNAAAAEGLSRAAAQIHDDWDVPRLPWLVVLRWLGHPPPPPPPWLEAIGHAAGSAMLGARLGGDFGEQLRAAATALILEQVAARGAP